MVIIRDYLLKEKTNKLVKKYIKELTEELLDQDFFESMNWSIKLHQKPFLKMFIEYLDIYEKEYSNENKNKYANFYDTELFDKIYWDLMEGEDCPEMEETRKDFKQVATFHREVNEFLKTGDAHDAIYNAYTAIINFKEED